MSTFKTALRVAAAHPLYIVIYTVFVSLMGVFVALSVASGSPDGPADAPAQGSAYEPYGAKVAVVDRDGSALSRALGDYLGGRYERVDVADDEAELQNAVATGRADCVFFVPAGFSEELLSAARSGGELPQVQEAYGVSTQASALAGMDVQRWVSLAAASVSLDPSANEAQVIDLAERSADERADVEVHVAQAENWAVDQISVFLKFASYAITSSVVISVGLVLSVLSEPELRRRLEAGPQTPRSRALGALASCLVLTLAVCTVTTLVGLVGLRGAVASLPAWQVALAFGTSYVFGLVPLAIAFLLGSLGAREEALNACGNILGMVMSFMGGAWVPLSFMGATVVAAAHFFPTFWTNAAIDAALGAADSGFSAAGASAYLTGIGITALFAVAIAAVGLALARNRQQGR